MVRRFELYRSIRCIKDINNRLHPLGCFLLDCCRAGYIPVQPDGNADGLIGLSDMLDVLSLYGLGFEIDGLSVWSTELDSTNATGWPNVPDFDPDNPPEWTFQKVVMWRG